MSLKEYQKKRNFRRTPEPKGKQTQPGGHQFVVQKHAARRLHYDFRLELDGVLKSWAVPKGPSLDPHERRLAVHVEDHPLEYGSFEGVIPPNEYGGGTVMLWDRGEWESTEGTPAEAYQRGRLKLQLRGEKLRGGWTLVRMGGEAGQDGKNWLLIKERDETARPLSEGDLLEAQAQSVATGRTMEEIAAAEDRVWRSHRAVAPPQNGDGKRQTGARPSAKPPEPAQRPDASKLTKAVKRKQPASLRPQLATLVQEAPEGEKWLHEIKFDGYRMLGMLSGEKARLLTRQGNDWTAKFSAIAAALPQLPVRQAIVDGEIVALRPDGRTDFQALQNALKGNRQVELAYYLFDLPHCDGYDLTRSPLHERKALLHALLSAPGVDDQRLRYSDHVVGRGPEVYAQASRHGLEGIICKWAESAYETRRARTWLKLKCALRQEFVIGGFTNPRGPRQGFGALLVGYYEDATLRYAGRVGTGFNDATLRELHAALRERERKTPAFANPPKGAEARGVHWVAPELVAEVQFAGWTEDGILRHPSFNGLREDKPPKQITRERPAETAAEAPAKPPAAKPATVNAVAEHSVTVAGIPLTNPGRVYYPDANLTKLDLAHFYETIADWVLPHVTERPLSIVRCPQGHTRTCFFQKHANETLPDAIQPVTVPEKEGKADYLMIRDLPGLIALVQLGALEIHPWGSKADRPEGPDLITFDLDPGEGVDWPAVVAGANLLRERLDDLGFQSFVKTSGGKGLHVVVPLTRRHEWDEVKEFAGAIAKQIAADDPQHYLATASKAKRHGRIFIDYLRNGRGATSVAAYSTRARAGAPVSTPLSWDEIGKARPDQYTVQNLPARLEQLSADPWADYFTVRQSITAKARRAASS